MTMMMMIDHLVSKHLARTRREQTTGTKYRKFVKNVKIVKFGDNILNHHE